MVEVNEGREGRRRQVGGGLCERTWNDEKGKGIHRTRNTTCDKKIDECRKPAIKSTLPLPLPASVSLSNSSYKKYCCSTSK